MEVLAILCLALVVGHVLSVFVIVSGLKSITKDMKGIVLEREETHRAAYSHGPDTTTDTDIRDIHLMEG